MIENLQLHKIKGAIEKMPSGFGVYLCAIEDKINEVIDHLNSQESFAPQKELSLEIGKVYCSENGHRWLVTNKTDSNEFLAVCLYNANIVLIFNKDGSSSTGLFTKLINLSSDQRPHQV